MILLVVQDAEGTEGRGQLQNLFGRGFVLSIGHVLHLGRLQVLGGVLEGTLDFIRGLVALNIQERFGGRLYVRSGQ